MDANLAALRQMQINREVTSVEIVSVYASRCHKIGRELNMVTEEYYDEGLQEAFERDKETDLAIKNGTTDKLGSLHGIPCSIKDHVCLLYLTSIDS